MGKQCSTANHAKYANETKPKDFSLFVYLAYFAVKNAGPCVRDARERFAHEPVRANLDLTDVFKNLAGDHGTGNTSISLPV
jgi:hypothetical protein